MNEEPVVEEPSNGLSQVERVLNVFVAPSATFKDIRRNTSWWLPFLLMALTTLLVTVAIQRQVGWEQVVETQIHMSPAQQSQMANLPPEQQAQQLHRIALGYQYSAYAYPLLILAISALAALVLWASFNFGLGARAEYGQIFCLWMYCSLPRILAALVTVLMLYFGGSPESFNLREPVGTNPAYYLPDAPAWIRAALSYFDVVGIWVLVLLIVGGAVVARVKIGQAAAVVGGWWLLMMLVTVAAAAAFS